MDFNIKNILSRFGDKPTPQQPSQPKIENKKSYKPITQNVDEMFGTDYRKYTISELQYSINQANQVSNLYPDWNTLTDIYNNMLTDGQVGGIIGTLKDRIKSRGFIFENENDQEIFEKIWFDTFMGYLIDARLTGFEVIQLGDYDIENETFKSITKVPRKHVKPHLAGITRNEYDTQIIASWNDEPWKTWTIYSEHSMTGDLVRAAKWYILKNEVIRFWAMYNQTYGVPAVIAKTSLSDSQRRGNLIDMLSNFSSSSWSVMDLNDEVEILENKSSSSAELFENFIRLADEQISKGLIYSTMILDDGSSRSQAEVHERNLNLLIESYLKNITHVVNHELIPRMKKIGFPLTANAKIKFNDLELTLAQKVELYDMLMRNRKYNSHIKISPDELNKVFGTNIEEVKETIIKKEE